MELNLKGKVVLVTGAGQGIGKAVAEAFAKEGCKIAIVDFNPESLKKVEAEFTAAGYEVYTGAADVSDYAQMKAVGDAVVAKFGRVDVWVNHAGIATMSPILEGTPEEWDKVMKVNLYSVMYGVRIAADLMKDNGGGVILNTSSFSTIIPAFKRLAYVASKTGINAVTRLAGAELAPYGIRVLAIAPGSIETPMQAAIRTPEEKKIAMKKIGLQRACQPEELAQTYVYLASDAASYMTSTVVEVSGGKLAIQEPEAPWVYAGKM